MVLIRKYGRMTVSRCQQCLLLGGWYPMQLPAHSKHLKGVIYHEDRNSLWFSKISAPLGLVPDPEVTLFYLHAASVTCWALATITLVWFMFSLSLSILLLRSSHLWFQHKSPRITLKILPLFASPMNCLHSQYSWVVLSCSFITQEYNLCGPGELTRPREAKVLQDVYPSSF